jgi:polyferredoxin
MVAMAKTNSKRVLPRLVRWRVWVQTAFLLAWLDPLMLRLHSVCAPVFHCYSCPLATFACPIGVLANFSALHVFPFIALGTLAAVGAIVGALVCGWACPFGYLQDLLGKIPARKFDLPRWTGHVRYAVLGGLVLAIPYFFGEGHPLFICRVCPAGALEAAFPNAARLAIAGKAVVWPNAAKLVIVILVVTAMFVSWRPWCRLFCPLGAIYGLLNRFSLLALRFKPDRCTECGLCRSPCRYGVVPSKRLDDPRCIRCLECSSCGAISLGTALAPSSTPDTGPETPAEA